MPTEVKPKESLKPLRLLPAPEQYKLCIRYVCPSCGAERGEQCMTLEKNSHWFDMSYQTRPHGARLGKVPVEKWPPHARVQRSRAIRDKIIAEDRATARGRATTPENAGLPVTSISTRQELRDAGRALKTALDRLARALEQV